MRHPLGLSPSKIIAVHLNYRSRAAERGRVPAAPSYFLKPPSSLAGPRSPVVRPRGCGPLTFEGEIAVVIGTAARQVPVADALAHVAGYAAANDFGLPDLRPPDRGSNLRAKGADGFTPVGPALVGPGEADPDRLRLRTWVNGELVQDATTTELLFPIRYLIADLSRLVTLEPGDLILLGTPAGSGPVEPGDVVEVAVGETGTETERLRNQVVDGAELPVLPGFEEGSPAGAPAPAGDPSANPPRRHLPEPAWQALHTVATATLAQQLRRRGIDHAFVEGIRPARPDLRLVGFAHTLRYVPLREDVFAERGGGMNAQKRTVEALGPGDVLVIEARGDRGAGTIGDILARRARRRGAAGIVTDGGLRDSPTFATLDLPTYYAAPHAAVLGRRHVPLEAGVPVGCGGVLVLPGDVLVGDAEGVVVLPAGLAAEIALAAAEQERQERFITERVDAGESIEGLYPLSEHRRPEYEAWLAARGEQPQPSGSTRATRPRR